MRNLVRACLPARGQRRPTTARAGPPAEDIQGARLGEALRLKLDREAAPGTLLQLFDDDQRVIATLRVDDHDDQGTVASVAAILDPELERNPGAVLAKGLHISGVDRG